MGEADSEVRRSVLLIEDEPAIADTVVYALETEGFATRWYGDGRSGMAAFREQPPDLVILDVGLPDINGFDLCRQIRAESDLPIIFLTARSDEIDRVVGLELGGDDYVVKPFSPRELSARVRARLRRHPPASPEPLAADAGFSVDEAGLRILCNGRDLELSRYEYRLFLVLLRHPGRAYSREQLMQQAWDEPERSYDRTVDTHIKTLRAKIRDKGCGADPIRTHRGIGYSYSPSP